MHSLLTLIEFKMQQEGTHIMSHMISTLGGEGVSLKEPSIYDVRTEGRRGVSGNVDKVREVAWI